MAAKISVSTYFKEHFDDVISQEFEKKAMTFSRNGQSPIYDGSDGQWIEVSGGNHNVVNFYVDRNVHWHYDERSGSYETKLTLNCSWHIAKGKDGLVLGDVCGYDSGRTVPFLRYCDDLSPYIEKKDYPKVADQIIRQLFGSRPDSSFWEIAKAMVSGLNLHLFTANLPKNNLGKMVFAQYSNERTLPNGDFARTTYGPGSVVVDANKCKDRGMSVPALTVIHECLHWILHSWTFELGRLYEKKDIEIVCNSNETAEGSYSVRRNSVIESQALGISPYILVSSEKVQQIAMEASLFKTGLPQLVVSERREIFDTCVETLGFTRETTKRLLLAHGFDSLRGIRVWQDGDYLDDYCVPKGFLAADETFDIPWNEMGQLYENDPVLREMIDSRQYIYVDGHVVRNRSVYVHSNLTQEPRLTDIGCRTASECFVKFKVTYEGTKEDVFFEGGINRVPSSMKPIYQALHDKSLSVEESEKAASAWDEHVNGLVGCFVLNDFAETLCRLMTKVDVHYKDLVGKGLSEAGLTNLRNGTTEAPGVGTLAYLASRMNLPYEIMPQFFDIGGKNFFKYHKEISRYKKYLMDDSPYSDKECAYMLDA